MRGFELLLAGIVAVMLAAGMPTAQYWFQSGAIGSQNASFNNGVSASIQTVYPQSDINGSFGFWIGETLSNGAFAQVGYEVPNATAVYPESCNISSCTGNVTLYAGIPTWFWEYFPAGGPSSGFYGGVGQNDSVGPNGSFNTFSFESFGDVWYFYMDGKVLGSVDLGTSNSGAFSPTAFAEYADTYNNNAYMKPVIFSNLSIYKNGIFLPVPEAHTYVGYGKGSDDLLPNPYGVKEIGNRVNYFEVGSGLPLYNGTILWREGFYLHIDSQYNVSGAGEYMSASSVRISAPQSISLGVGKRALFDGWKGYGYGSYTGSSANATVYMAGNITEQAEWRTQYYVNVTTPYGNAYGSGWYDNGSVASFSVPNPTVVIGYGARAQFSEWNDGATSTSSSIVVSHSMKVNAEWKVQYQITATTHYGNAYGSGWYDNGSIAHIYLSEPYIYVNSSARVAFISWSGMYANKSINITVTKPLTLNAEYSKQYLIDISALNEYGKSINITSFNSSFGVINTTPYIDAGSTLYLFSAYYKGAHMPVNYSYSVSAPMNINITLPVYDVVIHTMSFLDTPVNATVSLSFYNGTSLNFSTGAGGNLMLSNVPLGYAYGYAKYLGFMSPIYASGGRVVTLFFITRLFASVVAAAMIVIVVLIVRLRRGKKRQKR
ncbi:MAG: hypothetical protein ACP5MZ_00990 [Candidatus Micrarchaeia archaeon]